jgi:hypothetical protein
LPSNVVLIIVTGGAPSTGSVVTTRPSIIFYRLLLNSAPLRRLPEDGNVMPKHVGATIHN